MTDKETMQIAMAALKELVAQTECRFFAIKHDHFAMQDARSAIRRLEEALANHIPDDTKMVSGVKDSLTTQQEQGEVQHEKK